MGYAHIPNSYRPEAQWIFFFKQVYCAEKIDGTSAHLAWSRENDGSGSELRFFSGGAKHSSFVDIFNVDALKTAFAESGHDKVTVYGEAHGGKVQGMSARYGQQLRFVAFDVSVGNGPKSFWLLQPQAEALVRKLGLEFVHYRLVPTDLAALDAERDAPSEQARHNGVKGNQPREGVVIRPPVELVDTHGNRLIAKHKRPENRETKSPREVTDDPAKFVVLQAAAAIAEEWVTPTRLDHVLDKLQCENISDTPKVIEAMLADVLREGSGEFLDSKEARRAISYRAAQLFKQRLVASCKRGTCTF